MRRLSPRAVGAPRGALLSLMLLLPSLRPFFLVAEEAKPYLVGICILRDGGLPLSAKPFLSAFPRLLALNARPFPPRLADEAYREEAKARLEAAEVFRLGAELASALDKKAALFLDPELTGIKRRDSLVRAEKELAGAAEALETARTPAPRAPERERAREVRLWEEEASASLIEQGGKDPRSLARSKGIDLLLYGQAEALGDYVSLRLSGYEASLDREVFSWQAYADPSDPGPLAKELAERLGAWVAGRPFARLDIAVDPPSALVLVDGKPFDASSGGIYRFDASRIILGAWAPGRSSEAQALDLGPGDRRKIEIELLARSYGLATVSTEPPGAGLFAEGFSLGTSPLGVELSGARSVIVAEAPGYEAARSVLPAEGKPGVKLVLRPEDGLGSGGRVEGARDRFYKALGWVVITLPAASLSLDAFRSYNEAYLRSQGEDEGLLALRNTAGLGFAASALLGLGLAINTAISLGDYVGAAR